MATITVKTIGSTLGFISAYMYFRDNIWIMQLLFQTQPIALVYLCRNIKDLKRVMPTSNVTWFMIRTIYSWMK